MTFKILSGWLALGLVVSIGGCASQELVDSAARPGKYRLYNCEELTTRGIEIIKREKELRELMAKARQGPGGEIAVALAYQSEYNLTLGDLQELETAGAARKCTLKHRPMSDQVVR
ncbi:MAG: hypothetical protein ABW198_05395 [Pseudorhodoplanes sp.]